MDTIASIVTLLIAIGVCLTAGFALGYLIARLRERSSGEQSRIQVAQLEAEARAANEKVVYLQNIRQEMENTFTALASGVLSKATDDLVKNNSTQLELGKNSITAIVDPLKVNLTALDKNIRDLEGKRESAYGSLTTQVTALTKTNDSLQFSTQALANAMRSPTIRGRWGEIQLRRIVELASMNRNVDFEEQITGDEGRADMIIHLSNQGILPLDSKAPLNAYLEAMECQSQEDRDAKLELHAKAMKARISELGQKKYWEQFKESKAPDFVIMFVPNESCLAAALEADTGLMEYAISQKVIIASPFTLLALLRTVAYGWSQTQIAENAQEIAELGKELYKRLDKFVSLLGGMGTGLNSVVKQYNEVIGSFDHRLLPTARKMEQAGLSESELALPETIDLKAKSGME
jgi:DNA recombination protein RmuC